MGQFIEKKNIVLAFEKYQGQDGQEKTAWRTIGEIAVFKNDDQTISEVVKLYSMPGANIRVFPPKDKQPQPTQPVTPVQASEIPVIDAGGPTQTPPTDEISVENIPF